MLRPLEGQGGLGSLLNTCMRRVHWGNSKISTTFQRNSKCTYVHLLWCNWLLPSEELPYMAGETISVSCKKINPDDFNSVDKSLMRALVVISSASKGRGKQLTLENHLPGPASDYAHEDTHTAGITCRPHSGTPDIPPASLSKCHA